MVSTRATFTSSARRSPSTLSIRWRTHATTFLVTGPPTVQVLHVSCRDKRDVDKKPSVNGRTGYTLTCHTKSGLLSPYSSHSFHGWTHEIDPNHEDDNEMLYFSQDLGVVDVSEPPNDYTDVRSLTMLIDTDRGLLYNWPYPFSNLSVWSVTCCDWEPNHLRSLMRLETKSVKDKKRQESPSASYCISLILNILKTANVQYSDSRKRFLSACFIFRCHIDVTCRLKGVLVFQ